MLADSSQIRAEVVPGTSLMQAARDNEVPGVIGHRAGLALAPGLPDHGRIR